MKSENKKIKKKRKGNANILYQKIVLSFVMSYHISVCVSVDDTAREVP